MGTKRVTRSRANNRRSASKAVDGGISEWRIQRYFEKLARGNSLHHKIEGKEKVKELAASLTAAGFLPTFPVDYLVRKRMIRAAASVLDRLPGATLVSTAGSSITLSIGASGKMFPDLVLVQSDTGQFVLVEIKRAVQTEREAITELLGYDHEIRNHLPFLSNVDLSYIVVSTEFSPLLDHSIAGLTTWESKEILCLRVLPEGGSEIRIEVYLPNPWAPLGQHGFPKAISIKTLSPYPNDEDEKTVSDLSRLMLPTAMLIAREAERIRSHGFVVAWIDSSFPKFSMCPWGLTVGYLNPYAIFADAVETGVIKHPSSSVARYLLGREGKDLVSNHSVVPELDAVVKSFVEHVCAPAWEGSSTWFKERAIFGTLKHRAIPVFIDAWGAIGDYLREITVHPAMRERFAPEISKPGLDWSSPLVSIPLLDELAGYTVLAGPEFQCSTMFRFGVALGRLCSFCFTLKDQPESEPFQASFFWGVLDLIPFLREMRERWKGAKNDGVPPPTLIFRDPERAFEMVPEIKALAKWIDLEFLGPEHGIHRQFFALGLRAYFLLDSVFPNDSPEAEETRTLAAQFSRDFISHEITDLASEPDTPYKDNFLSLVGRAYLQDPCVSCADCLAEISSLSDEGLLGGFPDALLKIADSCVYAVCRPGAGLNVDTCDWDWIKSQIQELSRQARGVPVVTVQVDGTVGTDLLPTGDVHVPDVKNLDERVVLFLRLGGDINVLEAVSWDDLRSGKPWEGLI